MNLQSSIKAEASWHPQAGAHLGAHSSAMIALHDAPAQIRGLAQPQADRLPVLARKPAVVEARQDVPIDEISFSALTTLQDIESIKYLRGELNLPGSVLSDPEFERLEKKETSMAWSVLSPALMH